MSQTKVLLGSIFPSGTAWNYNGGLNFTIILLYQAIRSFDSNAINTCAEVSFYFELFDTILAHFSKLIEAYQALEKEGRSFQ